MQTSWKHWAVGSIAALTIMAGGLSAADSVSAAGPEPATTETAGVETSQTIGYGRGNRTDSRVGRFGEMSDEGQSLLAEALGISVQELEAAQLEAQTLTHDAALAQAVADGEMTQAQADAIKELEGLWGDRGFGPLGSGARMAPRMALRGDRDEHDAYLAEALGIGVEQLQAAKDAAVQAGIAQAVSDGTITQEQADQLLTGLALKDYVADELDTVLESAIAQAVADGVVTQDQADQLQEEWSGFGARGMKGAFPGAMRDDMDGMRGGGMQGDFPGGRWNDFDHGRRGQFPGGRWNGPTAPDAQSDDSTLAGPDSNL